MPNQAIENYFAEFQTDRVIREMFFPDWAFKGIMVEVGAATPEYLSMSEHFRLNGWRCIDIEPNPRYVQMHRQRGHEIYPFACGEEDRDAQDFQILHQSGDYTKNQINDHSFSSLKIKDGYIKKDPHFHQHPVYKIKVNVRKLDTILESLRIGAISFLSVDVEGWELEVMKGLSLGKYRPSVVLLENYLHLDQYVEFMRDRGYALRLKIEYNYIFAPALATP